MEPFVADAVLEVLVDMFKAQQRTSSRASHKPPGREVQGDHQAKEAIPPEPHHGSPCLDAHNHTAAAVPRQVVAPHHFPSGQLQPASHHARWVDALIDDTGTSR
ncbi:hypothetical protein CMI37_14335 [Candidatus Pacearchaeota archaeon]|nr:hypothetical protein [Candidatus Pacearchaeota archaeon]